MMPLYVFHKRDFVGTILLDERAETYSLEYHSGWLETGGVLISPHLVAEGSPSDAIRNFLANLLPEGERLKELSMLLHISTGNVFGLVAKIGMDTAGALSFHSTANPDWGQTNYRRIPAEELYNRIKERSRTPIMLWDGKPRLSMAGVQEKLPVIIASDGEMGLGEGDLASTHLLKFGKRPDMHLVVNEFVCMDLARQCGLDVAEAKIARRGEPVLVVKRFDRIMEDGVVRRLHVIDGCQLLNLPPTFKYERPFATPDYRGGASLPKLFDACDHCQVPAKATRSLLDWVLFQLLVGNTDAHAKNISFFVNRSGITLAPAYDILNIQKYADIHDQELAMAFGDEFELAAIKPYDVLVMVEMCHLPVKLVGTALNRLCAKLSKALDQADYSTVLHEEEKVFARDLMGLIRGNIEHCLPIVKELPKISRYENRA